MMNPKTMAAGTYKLAQELSKMVKQADTRTYQKRLQQSK